MNIILIVLGIIGIILLQLAGLSCYLYVKNKEKNYPHFFSWNWVVIFTIYLSIAGLLYLITHLV